MARPSTTLLSVILSLSCFVVLGTETTPVSSSTTFIESSCKVTTYPAVCVKSLSVHADTIHNNPTQLAQTALNVSLTRAESMKGFVAKLTKSKGLESREYKALRDCLEEMGYSIDRIGKSVKELKLLGKRKDGDFMWHLSNVETWVSAALTDENSCMNGFSDLGLSGRVKTSVQAQVTGVAQVTSNALALVNHLANK